MPERCDCCGAYANNGGLLCEACRKGIMHRIGRRNTADEDKRKGETHDIIRD